MLLWRNRKGRIANLALLNNIYNFERQPHRMMLKRAAAGGRASTGRRRAPRVRAKPNGPTRMTCQDSSKRTLHQEPSRQAVSHGVSPQVIS
eukprot:scaffold77430_cov66-Phaeocystis_antarctica.AAC.3